MSRLWRNWYKNVLQFLTPKDMSKNDDQIKFHASSTGRLYIKESEFFRSKKVREILQHLFNSSIYKQIKDNRRVNA